MAVGSGQPSKRAATDLYVSVKTIEYHLNNVYRKLGIQRRGELIRLIALEE
jgi:DNA-binding CsgD family transcriptional regulator